MNKEIKQEIIETVDILERGLLGDLKDLKIRARRDNLTVTRILQQIESMRDKCSKARNYILKVYDEPRDYFERKGNSNLLMLAKYGIEDYCDKFLVSDDVRGKALDILRKCSKTNIFSEKKSDSIISSVLYTASLLCNKKIEQKVLAFNIGVVEMTIWKNYKLILKEIEKI